MIKAQQLGDTVQRNSLGALSRAARGLWHGDLLLAEAEGIFIRIQGDFRDATLSKGGREVAEAPVGGRS